MSFLIPYYKTDICQAPRRVSGETSISLDFDEYILAVKPDGGLIALEVEGTKQLKYIYDYLKEINARIVKPYMRG